MYFNSFINNNGIQSTVQSGVEMSPSTTVTDASDFSFSYPTEITVRKDASLIFDLYYQLGKTYTDKHFVFANITIEGELVEDVITEIAFTKSDVTAYFAHNDTFEAPELRVPEGVTILDYTSSDEDVAFVDYSGNVTFENPGTTVITAYGDNDQSASYTLTILNAFRVNTSVAPDQTRGTVTPASGTYFDAGEDVLLTATPNRGYRFVNWTIDDEVVEGSPYTIESISADHTAVANFEELPKITFSMAEDVKGAAPDEDYAEAGSSYTLPRAFFLSKEGYSHIGWNDGASDYMVGDNYIVTGDVNFTAVFAENTVKLGDEETTVDWTFSKEDGAPVFKLQKATGYYVQKATIGDAVIDVPMYINTLEGAVIEGIAGKLNNEKIPYYAQVNEGTMFVVPAIHGMTMSIFTVNPNIPPTPTDFTFNGESGSVSDNIVSYTYNGFEPTLSLCCLTSDLYAYGVVVTYPKNYAPISFDKTSCNYVHGQEVAFPEFTNELNLDVTFESDKPEVATVDATGKLTLRGEGTAVISATYVGENFLPTTVSYVLKVSIPMETFYASTGGYSISTGYMTMEGGISCNEAYLKFNNNFLPTQAAYVKLTAKDKNGFKKGDVLTLSADINSSDETKHSAILIADNEYANEIYKTEDVANRNNGEPTSVFTISLPCDADNLYIGRAGNTGLYIYDITIKRYPHEVEVPEHGEGSFIKHEGREEKVITFNTPKVPTHVIYYRYTPYETDSEEPDQAETMYRVTPANPTDGYQIAENHTVILASDENFGTFSYFAYDTLTGKESDIITLDVHDGTYVLAPISFDQKAFDYIHCENMDFPILNNEENLDVTYKSGDSSVATVDAEGIVTIQGEGTTVISASYAGKDYKPNTASYTLSVAIPFETVYASQGDISTVGAITLNGNYSSTSGLYVSLQRNFSSTEPTFIKLTSKDDNGFKKGDVMILSADINADMEDRSAAVLIADDDTAHEIYRTDYVANAMNEEPVSTFTISIPCDADYLYIGRAGNTQLRIHDIIVKRYAHEVEVPEHGEGSFIKHEGKEERVITFNTPKVSSHVIYYKYTSADVNGEEPNESETMYRAAAAANVDGHRLAENHTVTLAPEQNDGTLSYFAYDTLTGQKSDVATVAVNNGSTVGILDINVEDKDVEYYNLQGIRISEPSTGIFIRKQGTNVTKVVK